MAKALSVALRAVSALLQWAIVPELHWCIGTRVTSKWGINGHRVTAGKGNQVKTDIRSLAGDGCYQNGQKGTAAVAKRTKGLDQVRLPKKRT